MSVCIFWAAFSTIYETAKIFDKCHLLDVPPVQVNIEVVVIWSWSLFDDNGQRLIFIQINYHTNAHIFLPDQTGHQLQRFTKLNQQDNIISIFEISKQNVRLSTTHSFLKFIYQPISTDIEQWWQKNTALPNSHGDRKPGWMTATDLNAAFHSITELLSLWHYSRDAKSPYQISDHHRQLSPSNVNQGSVKRHLQQMHLRNQQGYNLHLQQNVCREQK